MTASWVETSLIIIDVLEALSIPYVVVGSAASILHGIVRTTIDTDLVADLERQHVEPMAAALENSFYLDRDCMYEAIARCSSFNLIHQQSMFKIDIFVPSKESIGRLQLDRKVKKTVVSQPQRTAWISSAEDIILAKLHWFRLGNEVSERQWRDIIGVLKTQGELLDIDYLHRQASSLSVHDLLIRAVEASHED